MGDNRPIYLAAHGDKDHLHVHFVAGLVNDQGKIWSGERGERNFRAWERSNEELEIEHGLKRVSHRKAYEHEGEHREAPLKRLRNSEIHLANKGELSPLADLQGRLEESYEQAKGNFSKFIESATEQGITIKPNMSTSKVNGLSFSLDGENYIKASDVGSKYKWSKLEKGLNYDSERDFEKLAELKERATTREHTTIGDKSADRAASSNDTEHTTAKARDSSGRFSTDGRGIGNIERDMPELPERTTGAKSELSNTGSEPQQDGGSLRQSTPTSVRIINAILGTKANKGSGRLQERSNQPYNESQHSEEEAGGNSRDIKETSNSKERTRDFGGSQHTKLDKNANNNSDIGNGNDAISKLEPVLEAGQNGTISSKTTTASPNPYFGEPSTGSTTSTYEEEVIKYKGSWRRTRPTTVGESELLPTPDEKTDEENTYEEEKQRQKRLFQLRCHLGELGLLEDEIADGLKKLMHCQHHCDEDDLALQGILNKNLFEIESMDEWFEHTQAAIDNCKVSMSNFNPTNKLSHQGFNPQPTSITPAAVARQQREAEEGAWIQEQLGEHLAHQDIEKERRRRNQNGIERR